MKCSNVGLICNTERSNTDRGSQMTGRFFFKMEADACCENPQRNMRYEVVISQFHHYALTHTHTCFGHGISQKPVFMLPCA